MKKVEIEVFQFEELEHEIQDRLAEDYDVYEESENAYSEAEDTVNKFLELFPDLTTSTRPWLDPYTGRMEDYLVTLNGLRLRTWLINNIGPKIYKPKFLYKGAIGINTRSRYSNVQVESSCPLTGVCWDEDILEPIHKVIKWEDGYRDLCMVHVIEYCFDNLRKSLINSAEYYNSVEYAKEQMKMEDKWYTKNGTEIDI